MASNPLHDLDKAAGPVQRAAWARENLLTATRTLQTALRELQKALADADAAPEGDLVGQLDAVAAVWSDAMFDDENHDPYAGMTNADVMSGEELAEYERDAEFHLDAIEEERNAALAEAEPYDDDAGYEYEHEDGYKDEDGEL